MLQNRGEFALILATLATAAHLDPRLTPFAGLYVLTMAIIGPILAVNSETFGAWLFRTKKKSAAKQASRLERDENIALVEAVFAGKVGDEVVDDSAAEPALQNAMVDQADGELSDAEAARLVEQAMRESDEQPEQIERKRDPEY
jgi:CPA2 family monovalent cation:H+ antiporter-2